jgi:hypothetical protein
MSLVVNDFDSDVDKKYDVRCFLTISQSSLIQ